MSSCYCDTSKDTLSYWLCQMPNSKGFAILFRQLTQLVRMPFRCDTMTEGWRKLKQKLNMTMFMNFLNALEGTVMRDF